jgi:hypothetical protein
MDRQAGTENGCATHGATGMRGWMPHSAAKQFK